MRNLAAVVERPLRWGLAVFAVASVGPALAQVEPELQELYGDSRTVSLAAGYQQRVRDAPASATIITRDEMRAMGARTADEVLNTIAGVSVYQQRQFLDAPVVRGYFSPTNSPLVVMIDGTPVSRGLAGTFNHFGRLLVEDIDSIEVVRGPASALYGADATSGVINIVTMVAAGVQGTEVGVRVGSEVSADAWLLHGWQGDQASLNVSIIARSTEGFEELVRADGQTSLDRRFGSRLSLAPDAASDDEDVLNARAHFTVGPWTLRGNLNLFSAGVGAGLVGSLDPDGRFDWTEYTLEGRHEIEVTPDLSVASKLGFSRVTREIDALYLPPGAFGVFPDGIRQDNKWSDDVLFAESAGLYTGLRGHTVRGGIGYYHQGVNNRSDQRNYTIAPGVGVVPTPFFGSPEDFGVASSLPPFNRNVFYGFAQDEWQFHPDFALTTGVRVDHFDDVGTEITPRVGLVWNAFPSITAKVLYGRGFRPPSYIESEPDNNLILIGNSDLEPETIDSIEASVEHRTLRSSVSLGIYGYRVSDRITITANPALANVLVPTNSDEDVRGYGVEMTAEYAVSDRVTVKGNYTYQRTIDRATDASLGISPRHQVYGEVLLEPAPRWSANLNASGVFSQQRTAGDTRTQPDDYVIANIGLTRTDLIDGLDVTIAVRNLFDETAVQPSTSSLTFPFDQLVPGREAFVQLRARF